MIIWNEIKKRLENIIQVIIFVCLTLFLGFLFFGSSVSVGTICYDIPSGYSIVIFLVGTIVTLKFILLNEKDKSFELRMFIAGTLFNLLFLLLTFLNDCKSMYFDNDSKTILRSFSDLKDTATLLNFTIWVDFISVLRNLYVVVKSYIVKIITNKKKETNKNKDDYQNEVNTIDTDNDIFSYWLENESKSKLVKKALTDASYKDIYRKENKKEMDDSLVNFEMSTYGDSILKMGLSKIFNDSNELKPSEKRKNYESNEVLVKYIASKYNLLEKIRYNKEVILINDYDYEKHYKLDKNGKKKKGNDNNYSKFIADAVEAMIAAIYEETKDLDGLVSLFKQWIIYIDATREKSN
jgi:dsRNA-specific ribonuclease